MIQLSQIMIESYQIENFPDLLAEVRKRGQEGQVLLEIDLKPEYGDTPRDWYNQVETAFSVKR